MDFELNQEQRMWQNTVHDFCDQHIRPYAAEFDEKAEPMKMTFRKMGALGLLALNIPEEFGGAGMDAVSAAIAIDELGYADGGTALSIAAHNGLGCAPISMFGSQMQKEEWLPGLSSGESGLGALALTEPGAGSDLVRGLSTRAELDGDSWVINGSKAWITNASLAPVIITLCRTDPEAGTAGFSLILVPSGTPGLHIHPSEKKMGVRSSPTHALTFENVRVPAANVLGEAGQGLYQTLQILDGGRISIGALSLGIARAALDEAIRYAKERELFGKQLADLQATRFKLADCQVEIDAAQLLVYRAAWLKEEGKPFTREAAIAKLYATEMAERVCREAIQILGSYGYSREYPVERMYRDARLMTIGEGTSEVQRMVIAKRVISG
ncbi:MAG: acyl-CoA dehydrogenase family protein [Anaerolineales bacterium]|nr:acyl-CoA dehydrogenase family protein [Anaerolineales bacterium]